MKVVITSAVEHDGKTLEVGDMPNLPDAVAQPLIEGGAALAGGRAKAEAAPSHAPDLLSADKPAEA